ncbi:hypothetical protein Tco_0207060 [Tanacetum coccineum]
MVIKEPEHEIFFNDVFGDQAFQRWNDIEKVGIDALVSYMVLASMVQTPENARFSIKLKKLIAEHPDQEKLKSKKVKLEALGYDCLTDLKIQKDYKAEYKKMKDEKEVSDDEVTHVKVLMDLADELTVGKNHAQNEQRLNLLSEYNKIVFELNKCRDELLVLKQAKLDAVIFQIQNTKLTKLNHDLQEQLKEEKKINEKWLTSSKKVSQCISKKIPHKKKKVLGGELFTEESPKLNLNANLLIPAFMGYDQEMFPKSIDWVERLNPDSYLLNFNTRRILVLESQSVNKSLKLTE